MSERDLTAWMWADACAALDRAEALRRQFFRLGTPEPTRPVWEPPVDMVETEDEVVVMIALPGVDPSTVEIAFEGDMLSVFGVRASPVSRSAVRLHRLEIPWGRFARRIGMPRRGLVPRTHSLAHGCLTIVLGQR